MRLEPFALGASLFLAALPSEVSGAYWDQIGPLDRCGWTVKKICHQRFSATCFGARGGSIFEKIDDCSNSPGPLADDGLPRDVRMRAGIITGTFLRYGKGGCRVWARHGETVCNNAKPKNSFTARPKAVWPISWSWISVAPEASE